MQGISPRFVRAESCPFSAGVSVNDLAEIIEERTQSDLDAIARLSKVEQREALLTYALEREQVVDVAYSEDSIAAVIAALEVDDETREVVQRAILWLQRDEALHAQYIRGRLLRNRRHRSWAPIIATQAVGYIGGWCSAVSPNHREDAFGLRRIAARGMLWAGGVVGRLPSELVLAFRQTGFTSFCGTNLVLERSAIMAYEHILPLLTAQEHLVFARILEDERRHAEVFALFGEVFDGDRLKSDSSLDELVTRLRAISQWLVPARFRDDAMKPASVQQVQAQQVPVQQTTDGTEIVAVADHPHIGEAVSSVLAETDAASLVNGKRVAIRVNFMFAYDRRDASNYVSPEVLAAVALALKNAGATDIAVIESPNIYDRYFDGRTIHEVAEYLGYDPVDYRLVDAVEDLVDIEFERGLATTRATREWLEADVRIVVAKLAGDPAEIVHGVLATVAGLTGRIEDEQFYTHRLVDHRTSALMLLDVAPIDLAIVDAWGDVADGPLGVMGCNRPSVQRRIYCGRDAVAVDATVISDLGADPLGSEFLYRADQWFGTTQRLERTPSRLGPIGGFRVPQANWWFRLINATAVPIYMNLSGNGRLFVPRFDEEAFPPLDKPSGFTRSVRAAAQMAFGLYPKKSS